MTSNVDVGTSLKLNDGKLSEKFDILHKSGKSLLESPTKFIIFRGLLDDTDRACYHLEIKNPTSSVIIYNIRCPTPHYFFVKPRVGLVDPNGVAKLFFTFKARCHRVPSDFCWIYSIYQLVVNEKTVKWIKEDEFSTTRIRSVWKDYGSKDVPNILHLAVLFDEKTEGVKDCKRHNPKEIIIVNDAGEVMAEEVPDENPSNDDDEMPPTALD